MADDVVPSGTFGNYSGTNADATEYNGRNSVCQRSGIKARPEELVQEWTGLWVLPKYRDFRNPQDFQRSSTESTRSSVAPETPEDDVFIVVSEAMLSESGAELLTQNGAVLFTENDPVTV